MRRMLPPYTFSPQTTWSPTLSSLSTASSAASPDPNANPCVAPSRLATLRSSAARGLVVDDDDQVRSALVRVVESQGFACLQASSGIEALEVLRREGEVPVCISDIYMPEMDGVTFLRQALQLYPDMAVIMLTGV